MPPTPGSLQSGWDAVVAAAPGHVETVRRSVLDPLTRTQLKQLRSIGDALLTRLDPDGRLTGLYDPESEKAEPPEDRLVSQVDRS